METSTSSIKSPAQLVSPPMSPKPLPTAPNKGSSPGLSRHISTSQARPPSRSASRQEDHARHVVSERPQSRSASRHHDYVSQVTQQRSLSRHGEYSNAAASHQAYPKPSSRQGESSVHPTYGDPLARTLSGSSQKDSLREVSSPDSVPVHHQASSVGTNIGRSQSHASGLWSRDASTINSQQHSRSNSVSSRKSNTLGSIRKRTGPNKSSQLQQPSHHSPSPPSRRSEESSSAQSKLLHGDDSALKSPQIARAISARRVSPLRVDSVERIQLVRTPDRKSSSLGRRSSVKSNNARRKSEQAPMVSELEGPLQEPAMLQRAPSGKNFNMSPTSRQNATPRYTVCDSDDDDRSETDLPIQNPLTSKVKTPLVEAIPPPPIHRQSSSLKRVTMVSQSEYSNSPTTPTYRLGTPVARETSPAICNVPGHTSYSSTSFLPLHPALADPRDSFGEPFDQNTLMSRPQTASRPSASLAFAHKATASSVSARTHGRPPIPHTSSSLVQAPDDSGGAINTAHPLLQAGRHSRFAAQTAPGTPHTREGLPLRHYRSQDVISKPTPDSEEKEVFMPPKRSSSLHQGSTARSTMSPVLPVASPMSAPTIDTIPPNEKPSPQASAEATPNINLAPPSARSSIGSPPSATGATPPAISRTRSPLPVSRSTPDLPTDVQRASVMTADLPHPGRKIPSGGTQTTPFYLNPVSDAAFVDLSAITPPSTPPNGRQPPRPLVKLSRPFSPLPRKKPFNVFPSTKPLHINGTSNPSGPSAISILNPIGSEKKGWRRIFGNRVGGGNPKISAPMLIMGDANGSTIASPKNKKSSKFRHGSKTGDATPDSGFMGVGKDGVWITRKNFLKT